MVEIRLIFDRTMFKSQQLFLAINLICCHTLLDLVRGTDLIVTFVTSEQMYDVTDVRFLSVDFFPTEFVHVRIISQSEFNDSLRVII